MAGYEDCKACEMALTRRQFLWRVGATATAVAAAPALWTPWAAADQGKIIGHPDALSRVLFRKLTDHQRGSTLQPIDSPARRDCHPNWHVSEVRVKNLDPVQRALVRDILKGCLSEDGYARVRRQMRYDAGGLRNYTIGFLGQPGKLGFMFMLAGRHFTLRVDGNYGDRLAFGGPVFYGHAEENHRKGLYYYQVLRANEVFKALDPAQRKIALHTHPPHEMNWGHRPKGYDGIRLGDLKADQKALVPKTLRHVFGLYGEREVKEIERILAANGGWESLHMAFYSGGDSGGDKVWDVWRLEGPGFVWNFRGHPHVHTTVHVAQVKPADADK